MLNISCLHLHFAEKDEEQTSGWILDSGGAGGEYKPGEPGGRGGAGGGSSRWFVGGGKKRTSPPGVSH